MTMRLLLAVLASAAPSAATLCQAQQTTPNVALLGDSFAVGLAPFLKTKVRRTLVGGSVQYYWEHTPGIDEGTQVVVVLGTNDSLEYGIDNSTVYVHQVERIVTSLVQRGREVLWVGPPCILPGHTALSDERVRDVDELQRQTLARLGLRNAHHISLRPMTERDGACMTSDREPDQVHFTARGYQAVSRFIQSQLDERP